jgi:hypothetical protein
MVEMRAIIGKLNSLVVEDMQVFAAGYSRWLKDLDNAGLTDALTAALTASKYKVTYFQFFR